MAYIIQSKEEFLRLLRVGDQFWHMTSCCCRPATVEGPCTITRIEEDAKHPDLGPWVYDINKQQIDREGRNSVKDLTNQWHGVFLTEESALEYFGERAWAYAIDPKLRAEVEKIMFDDIMADDWENISWSTPEDEDDEDF